MSSPAHDREAQTLALCMQCGLCCDGTFFGSVVIESGEQERLGRVGLRVVQQNDGSITMAQPCSALRDCLCSAYADRPASCAKYECSLRKKLSAGGCTLDEARAIVTRMRELLATIRSAFDCPETTSIWERILSLEEPTTEEAKLVAARDYASAVDAVAELLELGRAELEPRFAGGGAR